MDHIDIALFTEELRALLVKHKIDGVSGAFFQGSQVTCMAVTKPGEDRAVYEVIRQLLSAVIITSPGSVEAGRGFVRLVNKKPDTGEMPF